MINKIKFPIFIYEHYLIESQKILIDEYETEILTQHRLGINNLRYSQHRLGDGNLKGHF